MGVFFQCWLTKWQFPKWQLPKCAISLAAGAAAALGCRVLCLRWARGLSAVAMTDLGSCHFEKYPWEVAAWVKAF